MFEACKFPETSLMIFFPERPKNDRRKINLREPLSFSRCKQSHLFTVQNLPTISYTVENFPLVRTKRKMEKQRTNWAEENPCLLYDSPVLFVCLFFHAWGFLREALTFSQKAYMERKKYEMEEEQINRKKNYYHFHYITRHSISIQSSRPCTLQFLRNFLWKTFP